MLSVCLFAESAGYEVFLSCLYPLLIDFAQSCRRALSEHLSFLFSAYLSASVFCRPRFCLLCLDCFLSPTYCHSLYSVSLDQRFIRLFCFF